MEFIKIDKIIVAENIRKDYGDLTELTASIKEHGVRKPLEINGKNELVDGFRRLKAAKAAGLTEMPYFVGDDKIDSTTEQILSGTLSKNLNPVEEGKAYKKYMLTEKIDSKALVQRISKKEEYVKKRLLIADLPKEIQDELIAKRIEIGHALLLAKMEESDARKFLKEILREGYQVEDAKSRLQYHGKLQGAPFDKEVCKGCKFNGSQQSELFETGKILNGICLNKGCFAKKMAEYVKEMKEKNKDVLVTEFPKGFTKGDNEYECKEKGITESYKKACREKKENYCVTIETDYSGNPAVVEWFKPKKKETKTKAQDKVREVKLDNRIEEFKTDFLIKKCNETIKPGTKEAKALALIEIDHGCEVKKVFGCTEKELDKQIAIRSIHALYGMGMKDLLLATSENGVDIKSQFEITKEFLELHTKDQLLDLIKELKILSEEGADCIIMKKDELMTIILKSNIKGKVPKSML